MAAKLYMGYEAEKTLAHNTWTLYVEGIELDSSKIQSAMDHNNIKHIRFGYNDSFLVANHGEFVAWETMISSFLKLGYLCTLEFDNSYYGELLEMGLNEYHNFIPVVKLDLSYIDQLNYNATIKIANENNSNPGIWTVPVSDIKGKDYFTHNSHISTKTEITAERFNPPNIDSPINNVDTTPKKKHWWTKLQNKEEGNAN